jgi:hypothetical protein
MNDEKNKLATLQDRLDNALKDDYTALRQLEKTLPLSELAKKKLNMFFNKKSPKIAAMPVPAYAVTKKNKISLYITYLQDDKVYTSDYHYEVETNNDEEMNKNSKKIKEDLQLIVDDIYKQLNDKSSEYIYIKEQTFILNKKDFLNCQVITKDLA